jgi:hypothetical protein
MQPYGGTSCRQTGAAKENRRSKDWDRMIAKMKAKFISRDYQITLFRRVQNLRQKLMTVKEYTEEFYRLNIRAGHRESDDKNVARYLMALKVEEKLSRKQGQ